eukprot:2132289-Rhodomonas_salina.2
MVLAPSAVLAEHVVLAPYAMPGTDLLASYATSGTDLAHAATRVSLTSSSYGHRYLGSYAGAMRCPVLI